MGHLKCLTIRVLYHIFDGYLITILGYKYMHRCMENELPN